MSGSSKVYENLTSGERVSRRPVAVSAVEVPSGIHMLATVPIDVEQNSRLSSKASTSLGGTANDGQQVCTGRVPLVVHVW